MNSKVVTAEEVRQALEKQRKIANTKKIDMAQANAEMLITAVGVRLDKYVNLTELSDVRAEVAYLLEKIFTSPEAQEKLAGCKKNAIREEDLKWQLGSASGLYERGRLTFRDLLLKYPMVLFPL